MIRHSISAISLEQTLEEHTLKNAFLRNANFMVQVLMERYLTIVHLPSVNEPIIVDTVTQINIDN